MCLNTNGRACIMVPVPVLVHALWLPVHGVKCLNDFCWHFFSLLRYSSFYCLHTVRAREYVFCLFFFVRFQAPCDFVFFRPAKVWRAFMVQHFKNHLHRWFFFKANHFGTLLTNSPRNSLTRFPFWNAKTKHQTYRYTYYTRTNSNNNNDRKKRRIVDRNTTSITLNIFTQFKMYYVESYDRLH